MVWSINISAPVPKFVYFCSMGFTLLVTCTFFCIVNILFSASCPLPIPIVQCNLTYYLGWFCDFATTILAVDGWRKSLIERLYGYAWLDIAYMFMPGWMSKVSRILHNQAKERISFHWNISQSRASRFYFIYHLFTFFQIHCYLCYTVDLSPRDYGFETSCHFYTADL